MQETMIIYFERQNFWQERSRCKHHRPIFMLIELARDLLIFYINLVYTYQQLGISNHKQRTATVQRKKSPLPNYVNTLLGYLDRNKKYVSFRNHNSAQGDSASQHRSENGTERVKTCQLMFVITSGSLGPCIPDSTGGSFSQHLVLGSKDTTQRHKAVFHFVSTQAKVLLLLILELVAANRDKKKKCN